MTLNDLEPPEQRVLMLFEKLSTMAHISRVNCAEMAGDRLRQPANKNCYRLSHVP